MVAKEGEVFVGIDVGKDRLDVHVRPLGQHVVVANDASGLATLIERLVPLAPTLIVLEASGGYERLAAIGLVERGFAVAVVNPRQTRRFAGALGRLAQVGRGPAKGRTQRTDTIDAAVLAHFAEAIRPAACAVADGTVGQLQELLAIRGIVHLRRNGAVRSVSVGARGAASWW